MQPLLLYAEDDPVQRRIVTLLLTKKLGYKVIEAGNGREAMQLLEQSNTGDISAVLLDINMPQMDGFETLKEIRRTRRDLPVLMLTAQDDTGIAVKAIKEGASDFIIKPPNPAQLDLALKNAIRMSGLARELARLKRDKAGALSFEDIVGHADGLAASIAYARKAAASDVAVLLNGETGTGKELLARAIHGESSRVGAPFAAFNCSAVPPHAMDAALFGQEKTSGAALRLPGLFREAERGTLFLDDVHMLPPETQVRLLRALQQQEIEPLGALRPVKIHVRLISATHLDLKNEVAAGRFREDLYFRLNVLSIALPPLRDRKQDILPLAEHFLHRFSTSDGLPLRGLAADARHYLSDYRWPGNVRELESLVHRALVLCEADSIDRALLKRIHSMDEHAAHLPLPGLHLALRHASGAFKSMDEIEQEAMRAAVEYYDQNITRAAEALGMAKSTFYRKLKTLSSGT